MSPPLAHHVVIAAKDKRLTRVDLGVYLLLQNWLSPEEFLPLRAAALAFELYATVDSGATHEWHDNNVARSVRRLIRFGYLDRGEPIPSPGRAQGTLRTYRLRVPPTRLAQDAT